MVEEFLSEVETCPWFFQNVVIVSPFIELSGVSDVGNRVRQLLYTIIRNGDKAALVSELSKNRVDDFRAAISLSPSLEDTLLLHPKVHAKCGYALSKNGYSYAFMGSTNMTDQGLKHNLEMVLLVKSVPNKYGWSVFTDIIEYTNFMVKNACYYGFNNLKNGGKANAKLRRILLH